MILDLSSFLVKNSFGLKMKKGLRNLCNGEGSTSILESGGASACMAEQPRLSSSQPTLEEMILQLEMEEKMCRKGKVNDGVQHRMSCVSSCDILRSARNAVLNQYPRFSLDGKDAMYRSSFTGLAPPPPTTMKMMRNCELEREKMRRLPSVIGGESVIWCKPGVVGKLMGLDAMPIPLNTNYRRERLSAIINRQNEAERRRRGAVGSCSRAGYCLVKPLQLKIPNGEPGWPTKRFP